ncbi:MAG: hypothetical protein UY48_C0008G0054 [Candidatus Gottesmanbacteria bacterium GW2011_GWB1_49_7]|uniref:Uncharacterized protein n=1 Tax=Candidatus Gottesmanbacteria bacterium GW2011_GWB1_49_7 TaxID=1618448 RepID=A0A0G1Z296_9BACT|nr:MAG: hypothetical protein UY48_C0008G0054 [Candidatus Gottesmanbacteria bacterium GW2011_GWB1_49_7]
MRRQKLDPQDNEISRYYIWLNKDRTNLLGIVVHYTYTSQGRVYRFWRAIVPGPMNMTKDYIQTMREAISLLRAVQCIEEE